MRKSKRKKVIVAISGGMDSGVAAALLKKDGFQIMGVFLNLYDSPRFKEGEKKAKKIAKILNIPFLSFDFKEEFQKRVIDYFLKEHKAGNTPNPCVVCNKEIKFGLLLEKALGLGADFMATGHYARKQETRDKRQETEYRLLKAKDKSKDQSYFLWQLNQEQLKHIIFPIGEYTKAEVKKLAKKFKLPVLDVPESMETCFIQKTVNDFLRKYLKPNPGKIVDIKGKVIGGHQGLYFYTIGQRKGIELPGGPAFAKASAGKPYYVLDKKQKENLLVVTKNEKDLYKKELMAKEVNWILGKEPKLPLKIKAKIRYRHKPASATITHRLKFKVYSLKFEKPQRAITPGQSVVFYSPARISKKLVAGKGQEVLGGGIIKR